MTIVLKGAWDYAVWRSANHEKGKVGKLEIWIWLFLREYLSTFYFQIWRPTRDGDLFWDPRVPAEAKGGIWEVEHWKYFEEDLKRREALPFVPLEIWEEKEEQGWEGDLWDSVPRWLWWLGYLVVRKYTNSATHCSCFICLLMPLPLTLTN